MIKHIAPKELFLFLSISLLLIISACMPIQENVDSSSELQAAITDTSIPTPVLSSTITLSPTSTISPSITISPTISFIPTLSPFSDVLKELSTLFTEDLEAIEISNVTNLVELAVIGDGFLLSIEISSDGTTAAAVFSAGVEIYNLETVKLQSVFYTSMKYYRTYDQSNFDYQLSPNGMYFVVVKYDKVEIWQTDDGTLKHQINLTSAYKQPKIQFSVDNRSFCIIEKGFSNDRGFFWLISIDTGETIIEQEEIFKTSFSADGKYIAVIATKNGDRVDIYNTVNGSVEYSFSGPEGAVTIAFSPNEDHLAVAYKNVIWVWDIQENDLIYTLYGENGNTFHTNMMYTNDGHMLVIESEYNPTVIKLWDMTTGDLIFNIPEHRFPVLSSDKSRLVTFHSQTYHYFIWDLKTKIPLAKIDQGYFDEQVIYFLPDGKLVNIFYHEHVYEDGLLPYAQFSLEDGYVTIEKRSKVIGSVDILFYPRYNLNPSANILITWAKNQHNYFIDEIYPVMMDIRNPINGSVSNSIELSLQPGWYQFSKMQEKGILDDWIYLFNGNLNRFIRGTALGRYKGSDPKYSIYRRELISPDNEKVVAQAGNDLIVRKIGEEDETARKSFLGNIIAFEFSAESDKIFLVHSPQGYNYEDETISVWDFNTGINNIITSYDARFFKPDGGWEYCNNRPLSASPDGKLLAVSGENCTIRLISAMNYNDEICSFSPSIGSNGIMAFSPNSELLATAFSSGEIQIWNSENCELVHTIYDHIDPGSDKPAINFSFSPDGTMLGISYGSWPEYAFGTEYRPYLGYEGGMISFWGINQ